MISGIQFDNHTQEELPTLQIEYSTLSEENKGLYFLDLVEEGRVLIQNNDQLPMSQSINLYLEIKYSIAERSPLIPKCKFYHSKRIHRMTDLENNWVNLLTF